MIKPDLSVSLAGLDLKNPVMVASGTFGYGKEYADFFDLSALGALITKGVSLEPMAGNPPPRICETSSGMLNAIGLQNGGVKNFLKDKLPFLSRLSVPVIVNILGHSLPEYQEVARHLNGAFGIAGLEVNISCPNVSQGGLAFGADPRLAARVIARVRRVTRLPLIAKLTPQVADIAAIARAVEEAGADALSLINTIPGMAVDIRTSRSKLGRLIGGLSGPAIKPVALRLVYQTVRAVSIPVIGLGGIRTAEDALEFLLVGAKAVQIGTANFIRPTTVIEVIQGIRQFLIEKNISKITEWIGSFEEPGNSPGCLFENPLKK
ncbi:MAG TPA: dihydroorotate dehydrogenase [Thermodesulfobacteriota bacterium]|nr:dihydroorotate dehydrogenase [Thermodesulfobacteriota bacterium]